MLDSMLQRMQAEQNLNIYEFFKQLRAQRVFMVQTQVLCNKKHDTLTCTCINKDVVLTTVTVSINFLLQAIDSSSFLH